MVPRPTRACVRGTAATWAQSSGRNPTSIGRLAFSSLTSTEPLTSRLAGQSSTNPGSQRSVIHQGNFCLNPLIYSEYFPFSPVFPPLLLICAFFLRNNHTFSPVNYANSSYFVFKPRNAVSMTTLVLYCIIN